MTHQGLAAAFVRVKGFDPAYAALVIVTVFDLPATGVDDGGDLIVEVVVIAELVLPVVVGKIKLPRFWRFKTAIAFNPAKSFWAASLGLYFFILPSSFILHSSLIQFLTDFALFV